MKRGELKGNRGVRYSPRGPMIRKAFFFFFYSFPNPSILVLICGRLTGRMGGLKETGQKRRRGKHEHRPQFA